MVDADTTALRTEKRMYASEKEFNFRQLSKLLATTSPRPLTVEDRASRQITGSISALAEFAEIAHGLLDPSWVLEPLNRKILGRKGFPLEDYRTIAGTSDTGELLEDIRFVSKFVGQRGDLQGFTALRMDPRTAAHAVDEQYAAPFRPQVILTFSGTSNARLAIYDIKANQARYQTSFLHPKKELWRVHDGFQMVFQGVRTSARRALREAIESLHKEIGTRSGEWDLVLTAHSLGTAISYLFLLDILHEGISPDSELHQECDSLPFIPPSVGITIASFGPPRLANPALVDHFNELVREFRERRGREETFTEWTVIGHNDGVPALPPVSFGFAHMTSNPFYLYQGTLYKIPTSEKEHGLFHIDMATIPPIEVKSTSRPLHPKGGHNYYAGRDMEKLQRRLKSIAKDIAKAARQPAITEQRHRCDSEPGTSGEKETKSPDSLQRRYSSGGPRQTSYNDPNPTPPFKGLARATSMERHPRGSVIVSGPTAPLSACVFRGQSGNHAGVVNPGYSPIPGVEVTSGKLVQGACPNTSSQASQMIEESYPLPSRGPAQTDPPWVALYLARERTEDRLWEEKLTRSVWGTIRGVVGFGAAGNAKDKSRQASFSVVEKEQTT